MKHVTDNYGRTRESPQKPATAYSPRTTLVDRPRVLKHRNSATAASATGRRRRESTRPRSPPLICNGFSAVLSESEFEFCRQNLTRIILQCNDRRFFHLSELLTSLSHCFRPLHRTEVVNLFRLFSQTTDSAQEDLAEPSTTFERLRAMCEDILRLDSQGFVHFTLPVMKQFLLSYQIHDIDRSHFTIARACLAQILEDQREVSTHGERSKAETSFSSYATQYWHKHYRYVQTSHPGLTAQADQILQTQISRRMRLGDEHTRQHVMKLELAKRFCEETDLKVLLERYQQLLNYHQTDFSSRYTLRQPNCTDRALTDVSDAFARMMSSSSDEEGDWIVLERASR